MKIAFYKWSWNIIDKIIRLWTWQKYSHCELIFPWWDSFSSSAIDWWVRFKRIKFNPDNWDIIQLELWADQVINMLYKAKQESWKWYDYFAIFFNHILDFWAECPNRWFCSEICWYLLWIENSYKLTPEDLYNKIVW